MRTATISGLTRSLNSNLKIIDRLYEKKTVDLVIYETSHYELTFST